MIPSYIFVSAALKPRTIAIMHGSSITGEVTPVLEGLANYYQEKLRKAVEAPR